jgi:Na+-translocating ferredoxin:NAD+ oxidoreductase subunit B
MHTVIAELCTGCELCVPPCPVDCIDMAPAAQPAWSDERATVSRQRYESRNARMARIEEERAARLAAAAARQRTA